MPFSTTLAAVRRFVAGRLSERNRIRQGNADILAHYRAFHGREPERDAPERFNDFLFNRMIDTHTRGNALFTQLADKVLVRDFVGRCIGSRHLVPLIWVGDNPSDIPFDSLPSSYIIKTNHGSGGHIKSSASLERADIIARLKESLGRSYYSLNYGFREYHYHAIVPKILIETLIDDGCEAGPLTYRLFCFGGTPRVIQVDDADGRIKAFYDLEWGKLDLKYRDVEYVDVRRPPHLEALIECAGLLSEGIDFVRVDLYDTPQGVLFGEMTFTPLAGEMKFSPDAWDKILGSYWMEASRKLNCASR